MKSKIGILFILALMIVAFVTVYALFIKKGTESPEQFPKEALKSLPYLTWIPDKENINKSSVTVYERKKSSDGINIYNSRNLAEAYLIDMNGHSLHTWSTPSINGDEFQHVEMCQNGDLIALVKDVMLIKLDWNSNIKWISLMPCHHDIAVAENGDVLTLIKESAFIPRIDSERNITVDYLMVLSPDGGFKKKISLGEILSSDETVLSAIKKTKEEEIFHTNTVEIIDRDVFHDSRRLFKKGDILVCCRNINLIAVIDTEKEEVVWGWSENTLDMPHHPSLLKNGNILIFDNGAERKYSRIVELNPLTKKIVWEFKSSPPEIFFSLSRGSCQKLPNGNVLITESDRGRVFEITQEGEIVWDFYNPQILQESNERAAVYRMMRITDLENYPFLKDLIR